MSEPREDGHYQWRLLDDAWFQTEEEWRDGAAERFRRDHWDPLQVETDAYCRSLDELIEILRAAQEEANRP